jgi:UPF0755 protein
VSEPSEFRHRRFRRILRTLTAGVFLLLGIAAAGLWRETRPVTSANGDAAPRVVIIPTGESAWGIGRRLAGAGVVRSDWVVVFVARVLEVADRMQAGEYAVRPTQSVAEIVQIMARGESIQHRVTIPEGYTAAQIAGVLADAGLGNRERFLDLALRGGHRLARPTLADLPGGSLEGYLFPDTYLFSRGLDEASIIGRFLDRFDAKVSPQIREAARVRGLTLHQLLIVASMIEREARVPEERPVIAGVIYNRLNRGMRLEIDATVLYALGNHKPVVTLEDLGVESPYNTYRRVGLPPGPIANPGLASIVAAAAPTDVPFLYYVRKPDGRHHFSRTFHEHLDAVRRYRP